MAIGFALWDHYEQRCCEYLLTNPYVDKCLRFSWPFWVSSEMYVSLFKKLSVFQSGGKSYFTSLPAVFYEDFSFSASLPILGITCLFHYGHSNRCEVVSHGGSNLTSDVEH